MKIKFLVADDVRSEVDGKFTVLGLFPNDTIILIKPNRSEVLPPVATKDLPDGLEKLVFLISVSELSDGIHKFKGGIIDPQGEVYQADSSLGEASIVKGTSHVITVETKPFIVKNVGVYSFNFYVDDIKQTFPFEIRKQIS